MCISCITLQDIIFFEGRMSVQDNNINVSHLQWDSLFCRSVPSNSLWSHGLQHTRLPCPSPSHRAGKLMSVELVKDPTILSSVVPFSSCFQSFSASRSFQMIQLFASGGQSIGVSASTSVLPTNTQDSSPLGWTGWISLQSKRLSRVFSNTTIQKHVPASSYSFHLRIFFTYYFIAKCYSFF